MHDTVRAHGRQSGVTLIELIVAITVASILATAIANFMTTPLFASVDITRRAELTDRADLILRRIQRDLHRALPNSIRVRVGADGSSVWLEYLEVRTGGRYRAEPSGAATDANACADTNLDTLADEDVLSVGQPDSCFRSLGAVADFAAIVPNSDFVVVYNLGTGYANADAYASGAATGGNKALVTATGASGTSENRILFQSHTFTLASPSARFQVISGPVSYECNAPAGKIRRYSGYALAAAQPGSAPAGATSTLVSDDIAACDFVYTSGATERSGLVSVTLALARAGERVTLHQQTHVANVP
jgi:MSHA biogenesis protein MshO